MERTWSLSVNLIILLLYSIVLHENVSIKIFKISIVIKNGTTNEN